MGREVRGKDGEKRKLKEAGSVTENNKECNVM